MITGAEKKEGGVRKKAVKKGLFQLRAGRRSSTQRQHPTQSPSCESWAPGPGCPARDPRWPARIHMQRSDPGAASALGMHCLCDWLRRPDVVEVFREPGIFHGFGVYLKPLWFSTTPAGAVFFFFKPAGLTVFIFSPFWFVSFAHLEFLSMFLY
jgi:hypothetical protein